MEKQTIYFGSECGEELIKENLPLFFHYAKNSLFGALYYLSEDAAMDSIEKALKNVHSFKGTLAQFRSWIRLIVSNTCKDMAKRKRALPTIDGEMNFEITDDSSFNCSDYKGISRSQLKRAIHALPSNYKKVIIMTYFLKMSGKEISIHTGIKENNVPQYKKRAHKKLEYLLMR